MLTSFLCIPAELYFFNNNFQRIFNGFSLRHFFLFQEVKDKQPAAVDYDEKMNVEYLDFPVVNVYFEVMSCSVIII